MQKTRDEERDVESKDDEEMRMDANGVGERRAGATRRRARQRALIS